MVALLYFNPIAFVGRLLHVRFFFQIRRELSHNQFLGLSTVIIKY